MTLLPTPRDLIALVRERLPEIAVALGLAVAWGSMVWVAAVEWLNVSSFALPFLFGATVGVAIPWVLFPRDSAWARLFALFRCVGIWGAIAGCYACWRWNHERALGRDQGPFFVLLGGVLVAILACVLVALPAIPLDVLLGSRIRRRAGDALDVALGVMAVWLLAMRAMLQWLSVEQTSAHRVLLVGNVWVGVAIAFAVGGLVATLLAWRRATRIYGRTHKAYSLSAESAGLEVPCLISVTEPAIAWVRIIANVGTEESGAALYRAPQAAESVAKARWRLPADANVTSGTMMVRLAWMGATLAVAIRTLAVA